MPTIRLTDLDKAWLKSIHIEAPDILPEPRRETGPLPPGHHKTMPAFGQSFRPATPEEIRDLHRIFHEIDSHQFPPDDIPEKPQN